MAPADLEPAEDWAETFDDGGRSAFYTVLGPTPQHRQEFYARFQTGAVGVVHGGGGDREWLDRGPLWSIQEAVELAWVPDAAKDMLPSWWPPPSPTWGLLWALGAASEFIIEEPLRGMADMRFSFAHDLYRAIWEIRFSLKEKGDLLATGRLVQAVGTWLTGRALDPEDVELLTRVGVGRRLESDQEKLDALCFLVTLAEQNGLLTRLFVAFDGVERADRAQLKELHLALQVCTRWAKLPGMPLGLLLGWNGDGAGLGKANVKLANLILQGVA